MRHLICLLWMGVATSSELTSALHRTLEGLGQDNPFVAELTNELEVTAEDATRMFQFCGAMDRNHQTQYRANVPR